MSRHFGTIAIKADDSPIYSPNKWIVTYQRTRVLVGGTKLFQDYSGAVAIANVPQKPQMQRLVAFDSTLESFLILTALTYTFVYVNATVPVVRRRRGETATQIRRGIINGFGRLDSN